LATDIGISIKRGEIYEVDWSPARGSEQAGIRPALVIQNDIGNGVAAYPFTIVLAISSRLKGYPAMVRVEPSPQNGLAQPSEIHTGQILTVAKDRLTKLVGHVSAEEMRKVEEKLAYILGLSA
jgi:mRNA interferase MazF